MKSILMKVIVLILLITIIGIPNTTYALDSIISDGDNFLASRYDEAVINEKALKSTSDYIYNTLFIIAVVIAIAIGMIIGIQFMIGSAEDQAKVKETLVPYVIGVFVVFASFTIWKIAVNIGDQVAPTTNVGNETATAPKHTYYKVTGTWYWCKGCDRELTEIEKRQQRCDVDRSHKVEVIKERYYCANCNDELLDAERRDRECSICKTSIK